MEFAIAFFRYFVLFLIYSFIGWLFEVLLTIIKEHKYTIKCLIQLKNGILASCSDDETIKLFNIKENEYELIQTLNLHSNWVNKILELSNNYLV